MFVFYNIHDLILLEKLQLIKLIVGRGFSVVLPQLRLDGYTNQISRQVELIGQKGLLEIKEQKDEVYEFVEKYNDIHYNAGKSLLALIHFCKTENYILVVDESEIVVKNLADSFGVSTTGLIDFYKETINDEKYIKFIMELKGAPIAI